MLAAGGIAWWWTHQPRDTPATPALSLGSAAATAPLSPATAAGNVDAWLARVTITVTDGRGPIGNAQLRLAPERPHDRDPADDERVIVTAKTGVDGRATVEVAPGAWTISASASGHEPAAVARTIAAGAQLGIDLGLALGGKRLHGTITDASGGPIAGARVDATPRVDRGPVAVGVAIALSGPDGTYELTVPAGPLLVAATHADYTAQARDVDVADAGATADFALVPGGVIEGVVLDEATRTPVAAKVVAHRDGGGTIALVESSTRTVTTTPDGKFRIAGLRPGAYDLGASATHMIGRASRTPTRLGLGVAEQVTDVQILVATMPAIHGKVVDERDAPLAGASVMAFTNGGGADRATSAADGTFTIAGLPPGRWVLMARSDTTLPSGTAIAELADQDVDGVIVHVHTAAKVTGHVEPRQACAVRVDLAGAGMRDGAMPMLVPPVQTASDGTFTLSPMSPGKTTIAAQCASGDEGSVAVDVVADGPELVVKVVAGGSIAGRITDQDGKPVVGGTVAASRQTGTEHLIISNGRMTSGVQARTDATGAYEIRGLTEGAYRLVVLDRGRPMRVHAGESTKNTNDAKVTLAAKEHKTGVDLAVDLPNGKISGTVTTADGKPLADAWVSVNQDLRAMMQNLAGGDGASKTVSIESDDDDGDDGVAPSGTAPALTDASGHFSFTGLAHGEYEVIAEAQAGKLRGRAPHVQPDATVTIAAVGLSTLSGTVHAASALGVYAVELDGPTRAARSFANADGTFELGRVDPGDYEVRVTSKAGNATAKVTVKVGLPATVELTLVANAIVIGKAVTADGKPAGGIGVTLVDDTGDARVQVSLEGPPPTTAPDGTFRIAWPAGKKILVLMTAPPPTMKRGLVLEAGKTTDAGTITLGAPPAPAPTPAPTPAPPR
ncbi:MAG: carboxypeptidase-like regulatory domain-containing protein [Proteobacteria bacterium]|nr:carboxypeptidase-like regulatory domain-containing protein [Pseudomonadota bacterium]